MSLSAEYSLWLILPCLLLAAAGSWILYRNNNLELGGKWGKWVERLLYAFRFLVLFIIAFLILGPLSKIVLRKTEKPFVILVTDHSQSITAGKDSLKYKTEIPALVQQVKNELSDEYEVVSYVFGKKTNLGEPQLFDEKQTNMAEVFKEINNVYSGRNIGAIVLTSDGLYNEGNNPAYEAALVKAPVYAIAVGDTNQRKDVLISQVRYNRIAYAGNLFPMLAEIKAYGCEGANVNVSVSYQNEIISSKQVRISGATYFTSVPFEAEALREGTQHYIINVSSIPGEATLVNNRFDVFIQVISAKQKILLVAQAPHPDLAALKQSIGYNENYETRVVMLQDFKPEMIQKDLSLAILYQLPGLRGEGLALIKLLNEKRIPLWYILGASTHPVSFSSAEPALQLSTNRINTNEVTALAENNFSTFTLSEEDWTAIKKYPPLFAPYANYRINSEHDILLKQQIGNVKTDFPLWFFTKSEGVRKGFICGEGIWKWRLYDYNLTKQNTFHTLIGKTVQYLANKDDKGRFRINHPKRYNENKRITFDAEVYNENYELINTPEVQMVITNSQQKQFPFTFSKTDKAYQLDAGILPPGSYSYEGITTIGNKKEILKGKFIIEPLLVEFMQTTANHQLLHEMASQSGGKLFYLNEANELIKTIKTNENIKPVIYRQEDLQSWINLKWLFFLVLGMLSVEWFIRKWNGAI